MILASVHLYGTMIGAVAWDTARDLGLFEYAEDFLASDVQVSPLALPLRPGTFSFPSLNRDTFKGLPGLLADCLPDKFGNLLINRWLAQQGRSAESFTPVERLCYLGDRSMGALEFVPSLASGHTPKPLEIESLVHLANEALQQKKTLHTAIDETHSASDAVNDILRVGSSAGGARAKAVIAWHPKTGEIRSSQAGQFKGFEDWLIKFDGVSENRDKEFADPQGFGRIEYAYHLMARASGIDMADCRLLEENGRAHFMTRRFDRTPEGDKRHLHSLCGLAHFDFNQAGGTSYEQAFQVARQLDLPHRDLDQLYRRAAFNILTRNQDDHTKNISFLMDRRGRWSLSPAYDLTFAYNPDGAWTSRHQMSLGGKRDNFETADLLKAGRSANLKPRQAKDVLDELRNAVDRWRSFAKEAGVPNHWANQIGNEFRRV